MSGDAVVAEIHRTKTMMLVLGVRCGRAGGVLAWVLARSVSTPVGQAVSLARRVAEGDLSVRIEAEGRDEVAELMRSLRDMNGRLSSVVGAVRGNAESVATASAQIAQGNADLSQRTEEQASALQQTAASMEQLGHRQPQRRQRPPANQLALGASQVAQQGGEVVGQVVRTMEGIHDSSRRIAEIIGTIDGIAFQTNILALNAAVEAARAGEQGRGLRGGGRRGAQPAQRSAEAAREIKSLITASVEQVEQGNALATQAGSTMGDIVNSIRRVSDIVARSAPRAPSRAAASARSARPSRRWIQVTQQNAALVEESAAAAESLKQQADQLVRAVAVFKLAA